MKSIKNSPLRAGDSFFMHSLCFCIIFPASHFTLQNQYTPHYIGRRPPTTLLTFHFLKILTENFTDQLNLHSDNLSIWENNHGCSKTHLDSTSAFPLHILSRTAQQFSDPFKAAITHYGSMRGSNGASSHGVALHV